MCATETAPPPSVPSDCVVPSPNSIEASRRLLLPAAFVTVKTTVAVLVFALAWIPAHPPVPDDGAHVSVTAGPARRSTVTAVLVFSPAVAVTVVFWAVVNTVRASPLPSVTTVCAERDALVGVERHGNPGQRVSGLAHDGRDELDRAARRTHVLGLARSVTVLAAAVPIVICTTLVGVVGSVPVPPVPLRPISRERPRPRTKRRRGTSPPRRRWSSALPPAERCRASS